MPTGWPLPVAWYYTDDVTGCVSYCWLEVMTLLQYYSSETLFLTETGPSDDGDDIRVMTETPVMTVLLWWPVLRIIQPVDMVVVALILLLPMIPCYCDNNVLQYCVWYCYWYWWHYSVLFNVEMFKPFDIINVCHDIGIHFVFVDMLISPHYSVLQSVVLILGKWYGRHDSDDSVVSKTGQYVWY